MPLNLYLDECANTKRLVQLLQAAHHQTTIPASAGMVGRKDPDVFEYVIANQLVLLTKNPSDFLDLHEQNSQHPGILAVYQNNNSDKDMSSGDIVRAIHNLEQSGLPIAGHFHVLNQWRF